MTLGWQTLFQLLPIKKLFVILYVIRGLILVNFIIVILSLLMIMKLGYGWN